MEIVEDDGSITDCWRARLEGEAKRPAMLFDIDGVSYDAVTRMVTIRGVDNSRRTHMTYEFLLNDGNRCNVLGGPDEGLPVVPGTVEAAGSEWTIDSDFNQSDPAAGGDLTITGYNDDGTPLEETFTIMTGKPLVGPPVLAGDDEYLFVAVDDVDFLMRTNAESGELDFVYVGDPPQVQYTVGGTRLFRIDRDTGEVDELSTLIAGQEGGLESVTAMTFDEQDRLVIADGGANAVYTYDPESDLIPLVG